MKDRNPSLVSRLPIERSDLERLLRLAEKDREDFFARHSDWRQLYEDRVLGVALCQGAADHYRTRDAGINDFDVYTFYAQHPSRRWYSKRLKSVDFGDLKFGQSEISRPGVIGRRVDLLGRSLPVQKDADIAQCLSEWLTSGRTETARELARKSVVLLAPVQRMGQIVWPPQLS
jgi:hypothetical protein